MKRIIFVLPFFLILSFTGFKKRDSVQKTSPSASQSRGLIDGGGSPHFTQGKNISMFKYIEREWPLKSIGLQKIAQDYKKCAKAYKKQYNKDVIVAVLDTGIHARHPCLKNQLWKNKKEIPNNGIDDDGNGFVDDIHGWNFVKKSNDIQDRHGHGTHVSGIISAEGPGNSNCEAIGVAGHSRIMSLKYYDESANSHNNIANTIRAIKYAVDNGADIINYSGGGPGENEEEKANIALAADKNIIFVAALGNEGENVGKRKLGYYPANYNLQNILFVQSHNKKNEILDSSNYIQHKYLDNSNAQSGPGKDIRSTLPPPFYLQSQFSGQNFRNLASGRWRYGKMTGTSQATAFATGVTALVKTCYPSWSMKQIINQVVKTGFGQGTKKIKERTHQGKKLSAYEALIMKDKNVDSNDQTDKTNVSIPFVPGEEEAVFKNPVQPRKAMDVYDPQPSKENSKNKFQELQNLSEKLQKK